VIPTHNRAATLKEALDSVYGQEGIGELFDLEVVVVDDASTDMTPRVMRQYPAGRYIRHTTNRGQAVARNTGLQGSTGSLIALLDDDDIWLPNKLALQVPALEAHPEAGIAYSRMWVGSADSGESWPGPQYNKRGGLFRMLLMDDFLLALPVLIRRTVFDKAGYFDERMVAAEAYDLFLRAAFCFPFIFVPAGPWRP
jgi:glycosyltransferase involved in cell wall biosynthesis